MWLLHTGREGKLISFTCIGQKAEPTYWLLTLIKHQKLKHYGLSIPWARKPVWFGLMLFNQKGERFEKELTFDDNLKIQDCLFPVSILSEVILPKQNPIPSSKDQQLSILINESWGLQASIVHCMCLCNDFMLFKLFSWLVVDNSDSVIYSILLYLFICIGIFLSKQLFRMSWMCMAFSSVEISVWYPCSHISHYSCHPVGAILSKTIQSSSTNFNEILPIHFPICNKASYHRPNRLGTEKNLKYLIFKVGCTLFLS